MSVYSEVLSHMTGPLIYLWWAADGEGLAKRTATLIKTFRHPIGQPRLNMAVGVPAKKAAQKILVL